MILCKELNENKILINQKIVMKNYGVLSYLFLATYYFTHRHRR